MANELLPVKRNPAETVLPEGYRDPMGPDVPPEILNAINTATSAALPLGSSDDMSKTFHSLPAPDLDPTPAPALGVPGLDAPATPAPPLPDPLSEITGSMASEAAANPPKHKKGFLEHIHDFLPLVGAIGGALEAAGDPAHAPAGAEMLMRTEEAQRNRELEREKLAQVDAPLARAHSEYFKGAAPAKVEVAGINANAKTDVAGITSRYKAVPGVGLFDTRTQQIIPGTAQGVSITPELAQQYQLPAGFVGTRMKLTDLSAVENAISRNLTIAQGAKGPALVNKTQGSAKDLGLGSPAAAGAANASVNVWRRDAQGNPFLTAISRAEQLKTGEPSANVEFGETGPTPGSRNMSQMAQTIQPHLDTLQTEIQELSPYLGPLMGRGEVDFLAGKVGSTGNATLDYKLGRLMMDFKLASSAIGRTHFAGRTGLPASQYFGELLNAKRTPEELLGVLASVPSYIEGYSEMGQFQPGARGPNVPPPKKTNKPASSGGGGGAGSRPPGWPSPKG